jgi:hypothetical protein
VFRQTNAYFVGENSVDLRASEFYGRRIEYVLLRGRSGNGVATLVVNGRFSGPSQRVGKLGADTYYTLSVYEDELDYEARSLHLNLRGNFRVDAVTLEFVR